MHVCIIIYIPLVFSSYIIIAAVCADLPDPANGNIKLTGTEFGDTASYSCDVGFQLVGPAERICLANGRWSGSLPVCNGEFVASQSYKCSAQSCTSVSHQITLPFRWAGELYIIIEHSYNHV